MTKKDFKALAAALKKQMPLYNGDINHNDYTYHCERYEQWTYDVIAVVEVCAKSNPGFDKGRFIEACGIPNIIMG